MLRERILGSRQAHELDLVELVYTQQPPRVLAMRARFAAEAGRVADVRLWQLRPVEHLVAVQARDGHLGGRNEEEIVVLHDVHVILELGKLPRRRRGRAVHEERHPHLVVAVLPYVQVDHHRDQRPREARPGAAEHDESRAADLGASREVQDAEGGANVPMRAEAAFLARRPPRAQHATVILAARGDIGERRVGQLEQNLLEPRLDIGQLALEARDLDPERAGLLDELIGTFARFLPARNVLTGGVARGFPFLDGLDERASFDVERERAVNEWAQRVELPAPVESVTNGFGVLPQRTEVVHAQNSGSPSAKERKPQFGFERMRKRAVRNPSDEPNSSSWSLE